MNAKEILDGCTHGDLAASDPTATWSKTVRAPCRACADRAVEAAREEEREKRSLPAPHDPHGWIQTFTGKKFFPLAPDIDAICIEDIAHALSNLCRYTGHTKHFYSVAEHSVNVSHEVPRQHALAGLLHDATEAYLIDLAKPVKRLAEMKPYRDAEDRLAAVIAKKFVLETLEPPEVKEADLRMLATEAPQIMAPLHPEWKVAAEPYGITVMCWEPGMAREIFLHRFRELTR